MQSGGASKAPTLPDDGQKAYGQIDTEVKDIVDDCYRKAKEIILEHMDVLNRCAELLLVKEKIGREEFEALFDSREICKQDNHVMEN